MPKDTKPATSGQADAHRPDPEKALDFIRAMFEPGDVIELRAIAPDGGAVALCGRVGDPGDALLDFIRQHEGKRNLYVGMNPRPDVFAGTERAAKAEDIQARRYAVLDLDRKDAPNTDPDWSKTIAEIGKVLAPAVEVNTGNGSHVWLPVEDATGTGGPAGAQLKAALARVGSDDVSDLPRIVRLPWTTNLPTKSKRDRGYGEAVAHTAPQFTVKPRVFQQPHTVAEISEALGKVADKLALPGKAGVGVGDAPCGPASGPNGQKTPTPAPSAELLRMALEELPNDQGGPFDDRDEWITVGHAVKGAAMAAGVEPEARDAWLEWSGKWGGDPSEAERVWSTLSGSRCGWGTLMRMLEKHNPEGAARVKSAEAQMQFPPLPKGFTLQPFVPRQSTQIPPRQWLYGRNVIRGNGSLLVAPGGRGKSGLVMVEALAMATGRTLLHDAPRRALRVWSHNAEDDLEEMERRVRAAMQHHQITEADYAGNLFLTSGRDLPLLLAKDGRDGLTVNEDALSILKDTIAANEIDVLILDPLGAMHTLPENSNEAANVLMGALRTLAGTTQIGLLLVHHAGKAAGRDMAGHGASASRGASAYTDAARVVRQLDAMGSKDAQRYGIPDAERWRYVRVDNGKSNLAPAEAARWLHLKGVQLPNGTPDYPDGDNVQTVEVWTPPAPGAGGLTDDEIRAVYEAVKAAPEDRRRAHTNARGKWVGHAIAKALGLDIGDPGSGKEDEDPSHGFNRDHIKDVTKEMQRRGFLKEVRCKNSKGGETPFIEAADAPPSSQDHENDDDEATE